MMKEEPEHDKDRQGTEAFVGKGVVRKKAGGVAALDAYPAKIMHDYAYNDTLAKGNQSARVITMPMKDWAGGFTHETLRWTDTFMKIHLF